MGEVEFNQLVRKTSHKDDGMEVESAKYLGLTISNDMMWNAHIRKTVAKGNSRLGFLKRNLKVKYKEVKEKAYKAFVCPTLEYCCSIRNPPPSQGPVTELR